MKKISLMMVLVLAGLTLVTAAPVKDSAAAYCIKRVIESHRNGVYKNATIGCRNGSPTAHYYDTTFKKQRNVWAFSGSLGKKIKAACPKNPCQ